MIFISSSVPSDVVKKIKDAKEAIEGKTTEELKEMLR